MQLLLKYLKEIKNRAIIIIITWGILASILYHYKVSLLFFLFSLTNEEDHFIFTEIMEVFYIQIVLTFFITNNLTFLIFMYQLFTFFSPALYWYEYIEIRRNFTLFLFFYVCFIAFVNLVLFPTSWNFFYQFFNYLQDICLPVSFEVKLTEFFSYYASFYSSGFYFSLVILVFVLYFKSLNLESNFIRKNRAYFYFIIVSCATILTPPDVTSQLFTSISLAFIFETSLFLNIFFNINQ